VSTYMIYSLGYAAVNMSLPSIVCSHVVQCSPHWIACEYPLPRSQGSTR